MEIVTNRDRLSLQRKVWEDKHFKNRERTHWLKQTHAYARVCRPFKVLKE
jgi:hypothetical protein